MQRDAKRMEGEEEDHHVTWGNMVSEKDLKATCRVRGQSTYDVCSDGLRGIWPISDRRREGCVNLILIRGKGSKTRFSLFKVKKCG